MKLSLMDTAVGVVVVVIIGLGLYFWGHRAGRLECQAEVAAAVAKQNAADQVALANLHKAVDALVATNAATDAAVAEFQAELAKRPANKACTLTPGDANEINR